MYYYIKTDDKYALTIFETLEEATKALEDSAWQYEYQTIIKGDMIIENKKYKE